MKETEPTQSSSKDLTEIAYRYVKDSWIDQGIWNEQWGDQYPGYQWKHEEPPEIPVLPDNGPMLYDTNGRLVGDPEKAAENLKKQELANERWHAEQAACRRDRETSRPCFQFAYQVAKLERMFEMSTSPTASAWDRERKAYETVKGVWVRRGLWDGRWGHVPGSSWKHEWSEEQLEGWPADDAVASRASQATIVARDFNGRRSGAPSLPALELPPPTLKVVNDRSESADAANAEGAYDADVSSLSAAGSPKVAFKLLRGRKL